VGDGCFGEGVHRVFSQSWGWVEQGEGHVGNGEEFGVQLWGRGPG
jgi:hypothetical protein